MHDDLTFTLDRTEILVINQFRFLSIIFDKKLIFILHLQ